MITELDTWLSNYETELIAAGYRKAGNNFLSEDFGYWKAFYENDQRIYQVAILFYDFRKYDSENHISTQYQCLLIGEDRIDLTFSKDITIQEFENIAKQFYNSMKQFV